MSATAANLIERVLPPSTALRQWVLTFPFSWRPRLAQDGELLGRLTQIFVDTVQAFYVRRAAQTGATGAKTGAVTAVQRTSSDLRLNPHLHTIVAQGQASRWSSGLRPLQLHARAYDKPLCASLGSPTLPARSIHTGYSFLLCELYREGGVAA